jgi:putative acetyltransferase
MPEVEIRPFSLDDSEAVWRLMRQPGVIENTMGLPSQRVEQRLRGHEAADDDDHMLVAVRHGEVAGSGGLHVGKGRRRHLATLGIAVAPTHQRAGVGDALMVALLDLADGWLGLRRVELSVLVDNHAARRLYEKHGFEPEGISRQSLVSRGALRDELRMARLRPPMAHEPAADDASAEFVADSPSKSTLGDAQAGIGSSASSP